MYNKGSAEFNELINKAGGNALKTRFTFSDFSIEKFTKLEYYGGSNNSDDIAIGTTNMAYLDVGTVTDKIITNQEFLFEVGMELSDGTIEYAPMGYFKVQSPDSDEDIVNFKAYDRMQKFEKPYVSSLTYPTNSSQILNELCAMCGVELATPIANAIAITDKLEGYTCREVLGYIAGIHGFFACFDRYGKLNLRWYSETPIEKQIGLIWALTKSQGNYTVEKITLAKDTETTYTSGTGISGINHSNPYGTQEIADSIYTSLGNFTYRPCEISMLDDIRLDPWDMLKVTYLDGSVLTIPIMSLEHSFTSGETRVKSFGKTDTENEYNYSGPVTQAMDRMATELLVANRVIATKVDAEWVNAHTVTADKIEATNARVSTLEATSLTAVEADLRYANITLANIDTANVDVANIGLLFTKVGLIDRATIVDGHITGFLDAVEINASNITAGTLIADRLLLRGSEQSILYQLNSLSRNLLEFPYYERTKTQNGITFTVNDADGTVTANGTASANVLFIFTHRIDNKVILSKGTYTVSGCAKGGSASSYHIQIAKSLNNSYYLIGRDIGKGFTFTLEEDTDIYIAIHISSGATVDNLVFKPMLCEGTEVIPYEPYRERTQALTSETINGEVLTDRTITADKIIANSITAKELDVTNIFGNSAVLSTLISQEAFINAISTNKVVVGAYNKSQSIIDNIYSPGTTTIDGGKITTRSIKASSIDVNNLFAQNITATGTITGATLKGTKAEITSGSIGGFALTEKLTATGTAYLPPTLSDFNTMKNSMANGTIGSLYSQNIWWDINGDAKTDVYDFGYMRNMILGKSEYKDYAHKKLSNVTIEISPNSTDKSIRIYGTNAWGSLVETYIGIDEVATNSIKANSYISVGGDTWNDDGIKTVGDVIAGLGTSNQVSLKNLSSRVAINASIRSFAVLSKLYYGTYQLFYPLENADKMAILNDKLNLMSGNADIQLSTYRIIKYPYGLRIEVTNSNDISGYMVELECDISY